MVKCINKIVFFLLVAVVAVSCAQEMDETEKSVQQRILDSFVELHCPNAIVKESGLVILDYVQGTGDTLDKMEAGYFEFSNKSLSGDYSETTDEELAKRLGWFSNSNYYGPSFFDVGYESTYAGIEEAVTGLQVGGKVQFIMPPWLSYTIDKNSWNLNSSFIYDIEIVTSCTKKDYAYIAEYVKIIETPQIAEKLIEKIQQTIDSPTMDDSERVYLIYKSAIIYNALHSKTKRTIKDTIVDFMDNVSIQFF